MAPEPCPDPARRFFGTAVSPPVPLTHRPPGLFQQVQVKSINFVDDAFSIRFPSWERPISANERGAITALAPGASSAAGCAAAAPAAAQGQLTPPINAFVTGDAPRGLSISVGAGGAGGDRPHPQAGRRSWTRTKLSGNSFGAGTSPLPVPSPVCAPLSALPGVSPGDPQPPESPADPCSPQEELSPNPAQGSGSFRG